MSFTREDIVGVVQGVWSTMLGAEVSPAARPAAPRSESGVLRGTIAISGSWNGTLIVDLTVAQAHAAACSMLDRKPGETSDDDARDIAGELTNIIGGNVKALLTDGAELGLPTVARFAGSEWPAPAPGEVECHAFAWQGSLFWLAVAAVETA